MFSSSLVSGLLHDAGVWLRAYAVVLFLMGVGAALERRRPAVLLQSRAAQRMNMAYAGFYLAVSEASRPLTAAASVAIVNALGGGMVALNTHGWGVMASFVIVLLTVDLLEYAFHRLQHTWPVLWKLHSLHHSAVEFNVTVTFRHHWLELLIKGCLLYPLVGVLFKVELWMVGATTIVFMLGNYFAHLNLRMDFGRYVAWISNPQYHRLHHSVRPEHFDHNFAQLFPVWDHLFDTLWIPAKHEWPITGLDNGEQPRSLLEALAWPLGTRAMRSSMTERKAVPIEEANKGSR